MDNRDHQLLFVVARINVLSCLSIFTSQFSYISMISIVLIELKLYNINGYGFTSETQFIIDYIYAGIFYPIDFLLNCTILYLTYKFGINDYKKMCSCIHSKCVNICQKIAAKKIAKNIKPEHEMFGYMKLDDNL